MFGITKPEVQTIVVRDADGIEAAVREALEGAAPEERAGLERALAIVRDAVAVPPERLRARWVRERLDVAGVTGPADSIAAIKALRQAAPGLSLTAVVELATSAKAVEASADRA
ncbi:hypothetical protein [Streptomyces purpureus]|uniref:Uncharacterized protein n=1 Tax=Streptomyces purpureus TaxID=1951 RepID=A0A918LTQ0_9ACTN|nr:hypothetical protein [Streptomyces purpureus]GGT50782.1 hypothetical protein GCM10014713_51060 [Streptomyces purpureus]